MANEILPGELPPIARLRVNAGMVSKAPLDSPNFTGTVNLDGTVIINESGNDVDFRVESNLNPNMFFVDALNNSAHIDNNVPNGAGDGDLVMGNDKSVRFVQVNGITSNQFGITGTTANDIKFDVPGTNSFYNFNWIGVNRGRFEEENSGMGIIFTTESSSDHSAPTANQCVLYTKDNGGGKTQLVARFNTGAVQVVATQP